MASLLRNAVASTSSRSFVRVAVAPRRSLHVSRIGQSRCPFGWGLWACLSAGASRELFSAAYRLSFTRAAAAAALSSRPSSAAPRFRELTTRVGWTSCLCRLTPSSPTAWNGVSGGAGCCSGCCSGCSRLALDGRVPPAFSHGRSVVVPTRLALSLELFLSRRCPSLQLRLLYAPLPPLGPSGRLDNHHQTC